MKDDAGAQQNFQHLFGIAFCMAPWIFYIEARISFRDIL